MGKMKIDNVQSLQYVYYTFYWIANHNMKLIMEVILYYRKCFASTSPPSWHCHQKDSHMSFGFHLHALSSEWSLRFISSAFIIISMIHPGILRKLSYCVSLGLLMFRTLPTTRKSTVFPLAFSCERIKECIFHFT